FGELNLEVHVAVEAEGDLRAGQVELPHPAEALIVERADALAVGVEAGAPGTQGLGIVQAQDLDVGHPQAKALDDRHDFRQGRYVAAWKNVFAYPGIGVARPVDAADRVEEGYAIVG